ncbi:hypothetical protein HK104_000528 [Borealophlyctis nickersoniae]|nr:hypothetical protein HK104_000528 [Borealophlyctis nickersoniae]
MSSTSVKVAVRVRPQTPKEVLSGSQECVTVLPESRQVIVSGRDPPTGGGGGNHSSTKTFTYDHVFDTSCEQKQIYEQAVADLIRGFCDGFNATVFAYGQTGSGKTFSMGTGMVDGRDNTEKNRGIIPRAIYSLFDRLQRQTLHSPGGFKYRIFVSFLELHNEDLVDLLNPRPKEASSSGGAGGQGLAIREDASGRIVWIGVKEEEAHSPEQLLG